MSRIRSVHPGLFTDESFMSASAHSRLLMIGLWCEAWDDGVFEWKPLTLKVRLFPADAIDIGSLLSELEGLNVIRRFEAGGKMYGALRNFQRYQRPKKPNSSKVLPEEFRTYVGCSAVSPEPDPNQSVTGTEPVLTGEEDGGGRGRTEASASNEATASAAQSLEPEPPPEPSAEERYWAIADLLEGRGIARSRMGQLQAAHNGNYRVLIPLAESIFNSREPGGYLGKVLAGLREAQGKRAAPRRRATETDEPDFVRSARAEGQAVVVSTRRNGRPKFTIGREDFDETGQLIGF